jgi:hypothetical protein
MAVTKIVDLACLRVRDSLRECQDRPFPSVKQALTYRHPSAAASGSVLRDIAEEALGAVIAKARAGVLSEAEWAGAATLM